MAHIYPKIFFSNNLVDADQAKLSVTSSAILYGLSVYTVFPVCVTESNELVAFRLKDHFKRLLDSARIIGMDDFEKNWDYAKFHNAVTELVAANEVKQDVFVRATVHVDEQVPGTKSRGLKNLLSIFIYEALPIVPQNGARLKTSIWRRIPDNSIPSRAKVNGAYVNSVLAKQDAIDSGYDDCIFLDSQGHVCELSAANIFMVRDGVLSTPGITSDLLEGINRRTIIELAEDMGIKVSERTIDLTELYIADEVFACGTSAFVAPVTEIDARQIATGQTGPITERLKKMHYETLHGKDNTHKAWLTIV
ncbi:branched-chain-amino-acid transaminase [Candidatus Saccharibacteria bacterium]|nr:branched-chain-amino-acid transaminase [Candidatus Saccharibacteria bacterium]